MKPASRVPLRLEQLESRLVPASVLHFNDNNGDNIKFTSSRGDLAGHISFAVAPDTKHYIYSVDLTNSSFRGANFSATVTKAGGGDGQLIVGHITAGVNDLGAVNIAGDLGDIDAGRGSTDEIAIKSLTVGSMGRFGTAGDGDGVSNINGNLPSLVVMHDIDDTYIYVSQTLTSATIGGSLIGGDGPDAGEIYAYELGKVTIKHDIRGGDGSYSGSVGAGHNVGSITVGGSVIGGKGDNSGYIYGAFHANGKINKVSVGGSLIGSDGQYSGTIGATAAGGGTANVSLGIITIGHDIVGGDAPEDADVWAYNSTLDQLTVKGSVFGGRGDYSAVIEADLAAGKISIGGSVYGASGGNSAEIDLEDGATALSIGGSLLGGQGNGSAKVRIGGGPLDLLKIGHDIRGGSGNDSAEVHVISALTKLLLGGNVIPGTGTDSGKIG